MTLLQVNKLTKRFGNELAVNDISFLLEEGTSTALIGPNGAGKTTTLAILAGLLRETEGTVHWNEQAGIGFLPQQPRFYSWLTALEFTEMAAKISGIPAPKAKLQAQKTLEFVGLDAALYKKTGTFSGGMRQRLGLAQAIVHQPKLLLLDEPVSALDPTGRREIMELLKSLLPETTILYSTHILNDAEEMTDQLLFMQRGSLVEQGSLSEVRHKYADPRIKIRFKNESEAETFVKAVPWEATHKGTVAFLPIEQNEPAMRAVLKFLSEQESAIIGVEEQSASLEEIFFKVVGAK
ncbi:MAG TPA: ABC transporter ATP-binding protein [Planococcus sp. (in: firmicutes)]|nr:ABC transporter ATP-binding protein [Planococcus sp. (in: firmicutes)]